VAALAAGDKAGRKCRVLVVSLGIGVRPAWNDIMAFLPELVRTVKIRYGYTRIDYLGMVRHFLPPCYKLIFAANDQGNLLKINQPKHW
jgi:hypothetical protein